MPRRTSATQRSGCVCEYASDSVEPLAGQLSIFHIAAEATHHEPPKTSHFSIPSVSRTRSMSATRSQVVFSFSSAVLLSAPGESFIAHGSLFPAPRWSMRMMR